MFKKTKNLILDYLYKPKNFYSAERLKYIYDILCRNRIVNNENHDLLIDLFREIPEILIWGDQNDPKVHEFFFGKNMIMFFIMIIKQNCGSQLTYQILQAFNIIFDNISNKESLNAFLSNNNMNYIISYGYNENLVEIIAYYISLIKILSMKVEESSLDLFYDHQFDFPVFSRTILLFNHKERMIRIHVRNIILNLLKGLRYYLLNLARNKSVDTYFIQFLAEVYFLHLFANIRTLIIELNDFTKSSDAHCNTIKFNSEELFDIFQFLNDMLEISSDQISIATQYFLIDFLFYKFLIPALYTADNNSLPSVPLFCLKIANKNRKIHIYFYFITGMLNIIYQLISVIYHLPTQFNLLKIVFLTPTPKIGSEIIPTYAELDPISTMLHERGIVKNDYNIEHRIQAFLSKLFMETKNPDNVPFELERTRLICIMINLGPERTPTPMNAPLSMKLKDYLCEDFSRNSKNSLKAHEPLKCLFLHALDQFQTFKLFPHDYNNFYQMLMDENNLEFHKQPKLINPQYSNILYGKIFIYLNILKFIHTYNKNEVDDFVNLKKCSDIFNESIPIGSTIYSSDYEIASCIVITLDNRYHGFVTFNDNYLFITEPAPSPHYGSLVIKFSSLFNMIYISENTTYPNSLTLIIKNFQSLKTIIPNTEINIVLKFLNKDSLNVVFEKISSKIVAFNRFYCKILNKLGIFVTLASKNNSKHCSESDLYIFRILIWQKNSTMLLCSLISLLIMLIIHNKTLDYIINAFSVFICKILEIFIFLLFLNHKIISLKHKDCNFVCAYALRNLNLLLLKLNTCS
ncbi:hypothetical protein HZS_2342, partial [Henneguya salminicola]